MRLFELLRFRIKDVDLDRGEITVRDGKGAKDRMTMVPQVLRDGLAAQLSRVRKLNEEDREAGCDGVRLPLPMTWRRRRFAAMSSRSRESGCAALWTGRWTKSRGRKGSRFRQDEQDQWDEGEPSARPDLGLGAAAKIPSPQSILFIL